MSFVLRWFGVTMVAALCFVGMVGSAAAQTWKTFEDSGGFTAMVSVGGNRLAFYCLAETEFVYSVPLEEVSSLAAADWIDLLVEVEDGGSVRVPAADINSPGAVLAVHFEGDQARMAARAFSGIEDGKKVRFALAEPNDPVGLAPVELVADASFRAVAQGAPSCILPADMPKVAADPKVQPPKSAPKVAEAKPQPAAPARPTTLTFPDKPTYGGPWIVEESALGWNHAEVNLPLTIGGIMWFDCNPGSVSLTISPSSQFLPDWFFGTLSLAAAGTDGLFVAGTRTDYGSYHFMVEGDAAISVVQGLLARPDKPGLVVRAVDGTEMVEIPVNVNGLQDGLGKAAIGCGIATPDQQASWREVKRISDDGDGVHWVASPHNPDGYVLLRCATDNSLSIIINVREGVGAALPEGSGELTLEGSKGAVAIPARWGDDAVVIMGEHLLALQTLTDPDGNVLKVSYSVGDKPLPLLELSTHGALTALNGVLKECGQLKDGQSLAVSSYGRNAEKALGTGPANTWGVYQEGGNVVAGIHSEGRTLGLDCFNGSLAMQFVLPMALEPGEVDLVMIANGMQYSATFQVKAADKTYLVINDAIVRDIASQMSASSAPIEFLATPKSGNLGTLTTIFTAKGSTAALRPVLEACPG